MLARKSISEVKAGVVSKADGYLVVSMLQYPRFLAKDLVDEYLQCLSPDRALFSRYREFKKKLNDQNRAFEFAEYESEFELSPEGLKKLELLSELSQKKNVFLICQCANNEKCHVDLILLMASHLFAAQIERLPFEYRVFVERMASNFHQRARLP